MSVTVTGTKSALRPGLTASFQSTGGTAPYVYQVAPNRAGGTIDPVTGLYTAPAKLGNDPRNFYDLIAATDATGLIGQAWILVATPFMLVAEIIQKVMGLGGNPIHKENPRVWAWNQKYPMPDDDNIFIVLSRPRMKPFGSGIFPSGTPTDDNSGPGWDQATKWVSMSATVDIHVYSRGLDIETRLAEIPMALSGPYSQFQQEANGFYIARVTQDAVDLSGLDGSAIPYHYVIPTVIMYSETRIISPDFYSTLGIPEIVFNP